MESVNQISRGSKGEVYHTNLWRITWQSQSYKSLEDNRAKSVIQMSRGSKSGVYNKKSLEDQRATV